MPTGRSRHGACKCRDGRRCIKPGHNGSEDVPVHSLRVGDCMKKALKLIKSVAKSALDTLLQITFTPHAG